MSSEPARMPLIDAMKGMAAQIIVLHHLVSYGPLSEALEKFLPLSSAWLFDYGRMVVQVFLVVAGFLAARALAAQGVPTFRNPLPLIGKRYFRLAPTFMAAMVIAGFAAILAAWISGDEDVLVPTASQFLLHAFMLHGVFETPALSAGVWYVAIDFQLYALFAVLLWCSGFLRLKAAAPLLIGAVALASLFFFNLDPVWDAWAIYFFGSYALGAFAWWVSRQRGYYVHLLLLVCVTGAALLMEFRERIALALGVAVLLAVATKEGRVSRWSDFRVMAWLGKISYSVFLVHYPVCLIVNSLFERLSSNPGVMLTVSVALSALVLSALAGALFHRHVEARLLQFRPNFLRQRRTVPDAI